MAQTIPDPDMAKKLCDATQFGDALDAMIAAAMDAGVDGASLLLALGEAAATMIGHNTAHQLECATMLADWANFVMRSAMRHQRGECGRETVSHGTRH